MHQQLSILVAEQAADEAAADELLALVRAVVENAGPKAVASRLGVSASHLAHALSGRDYRRIPLEWLPQLVALDPERRLLRRLAGLAGCELVELDRRTDAEKLGAAVEQLESLGEVGHALLRKAGLR